jgi:hypothetical protein
MTLIVPPHWGQSNKITGTHNEFKRIRNMSPLGPSFGGDGPELLFDNRERESLRTRLLDLSSMGIGVEAIISESHLSLVWGMRGHPGNELLVVHPLHLFGALPLSVADLAFF